MKKIFCLFLLTLLTLSVSAQSGEVKLKATPSHAGVVGFNALASHPEYTSWYYPNSQVECYAKPKEGYRFVAWKRGNAIVSTDNPMTFIMGTEDLAFEAVFVFDPVSPNPPGVSRFDASTGELRLVNNDPFGLYDGLRSTENLPGISDLAEKVTNDLGEVTTLTLVGYFPQIIGDYKYLEPFYNLKKLDMSRTNLSYVGYRAFAANYNMETVVLPASVKKMEGRLFDSDNSICDIICYANIPPKVDPETFMIPDTMLYGMMKPIPATVYVPKASVPIYKSTEYWNELEIEPVVEEATNVVVDLPEAADGRYRNMSLVLEDRATLLQKSLIVRDQTSYIFYGLPSNTSYNVRLENSKGQVIGQVNNVTLEEESITVGFPSLKKLCSASVRVESLDGTDLTEKAQFRWMLPDGSIVGQQSSLDNMVEGSELTCQVLLGEELATGYSTPAPQTITLRSESANALTCQLQALRRVTLSGQVVNGVTELPLQGASVVLRQTVGGQYDRSSSATTDAEGRYSLTAFSENGTLSFAAQGCFNHSLNIDAPTESKELEAVALQSLSGTIIGFMLNYTPTVAAGETPQVQEDYTDDNTDFAIYNLTKGQELTQFVRQDNRLIITDGADPGDELRVTMSSRSNSYNPVEVQCTVDETNYAEFTMDIVQHGGLVAPRAEGSMAGMGLLYDSSGQLVRQGTYNSENLTLTNLPEGDYTLVSIGATDLFSNVLRMSSLAEAGLVEGTDYVTSTFSIRNGQQTSINVGTVPLFDESRFYYTNMDYTYFLTEKACVSIYDYETLKARVVFKPEYASRVSNVQLVVDLPDGVEVVPGSIMSYQLEGQRMTISLDDRKYKSFCVTTANVGTFRPTAFVRFNLDGKKVWQPIGSALFETTRFPFNAPSYTQSNQVNIWGELPKTLAGCELQVFDTGIKVSQAIVAESGILNMEVPLYKPQNNSFHELSLKVVSPDGGILESLPSIVQCYNNTPVLEKIVMFHYVHYGDSLSFDMLNGTLSKNSFSFNPAHPNITFVARFSENDPDKVKNLWFNIYATDGNVYVLPGTYDADANGWVGSAEFNSYLLPVNVTADYDIVIDDKQDYEERFNDQMEILHQATLHIKEMTENHMPEDVLLDEEDHCTMVVECENGRQFLYETIVEDYDAIEQEMRESGNMQCARIEGGIQAFSVINNDDEVQLLLADSKERIGLRIKVTDYIAPAAPRRKRGNIPWAKLIEGAGLGNTVLDIIGVLDYTKIPSMSSDLEMKQDLYLQQQMDLADLISFEMMSTCNSSSNAPALSRDQFDAYNSQYNEIYGQIQDYIKNSSQLIKSFWWTVGRKGIYDVLIGKVTGVASKGVGKLSKYVLSKDGKVIKVMKEALETPMTKEAEFFQSGMEFSYNLADALYDIPSIDDILGMNFNKAFEDAMKELDRENNLIMSQLNNLLSNLENSLDNSCDGERKHKGKRNPDDPPSPGPSGPSGGGGGGSSHPWPGYPTATPALDPQGYVYEGVPSNRLAGVTATVFFKKLDEDMNGNPVEEAVQWDAAPFGQINPQLTDVDGMYQWDVPQGLWQVKLEKEGYATAYSEWLPVPPPQLDVNIEMKQSKAPEVKDAKAYEEGINITFDKYMLPVLLTTDNISVTQNDEAVTGSIVLQNEEEGAEGLKLASKVRFVPDEPFTGNKVTLHINKNVQSYAYLMLPEDYEQELDVALEVKTLKSDSLVKVAYGGAYTLLVEAKPANAAAGKKVTVKSANTIAAVNEETLTLNEEGKAMVDVQGLLPGDAVITFSLDETDLTCQTIVRVKEMDATPVTATPVASIESESTVEAGTEVTLTCETENAQIWYTLDGSCPCVAESRTLYTEPIVLQEGEVTLNVMAEAEGYSNSVVATYIYHVVGKDITMGDVNGDGVVDLSDAIMVTYYSLHEVPSNFNVAAADMNGDGVVDLSDAISIIYKSLGVR